MTHTEILDRVLDPFTDCLTPEVAERIAQLRANQETQIQIDELARKANEGTLSDTERAEYELCVSAGTFIAILQSKARKYLKTNAQN